MKRFLPDYKGGSIVNLMSSIAKAFKSEHSYKELKLLPSKSLKKSKNIVLLVIDGMGYEYIKNITELKPYILGSITSVFPPTTTSAISTFMTGNAPMQHALTGWTINFKEIGTIGNIFRFAPKYQGLPFSFFGIDIDDIIDQKPFLNKKNVEKYHIMFKEIIKTDYNIYLSKGYTKLGYNNLNGLFRQINKAVRSSDKRKYIYAYWYGLDMIKHELGTEHKETKKHFEDIKNNILSLIKKLKNTTLIITADHGLIDIPLNKVLYISKHPKLIECLSMPLCGEGRAAYCYVHPSKTKQFETYVKKNLKKYCTLHKSEELINKNYFGLFKQNPKLYDRIGDYVLISKEDHIIKNKPKEYPLFAHHSGLSKKEMLVPLIVIKK